MVPAPRNSDNHISLLTLRQQETTAASATSLELLLITFALIISSVLALTPRKRAWATRKQPRNPVYSAFIIGVAVAFTAGAFALAIATLVLGWLRVISLSAVASIVFALGPAFISIPLEILTYWRESWTSHLMWSNPSLNIRVKPFRYIRFVEAKQAENGRTGETENGRTENGRTEEAENGGTGETENGRTEEAENGGTEEAENEDVMPKASKCGVVYRVFNKVYYTLKRKNPKDENGGTKEVENEEQIPNHRITVWPGGIIMVMRSMPKASKCGGVYRFFNNVYYTLRRKTPKDPTATQWHQIYGGPMKQYSNFATIQDIDDGITSWWWLGVSSAIHLVATPADLHMRSKRRVVHALALLSDIISIGDLVLYYYLNALNRMLHHDHGVRAAVTSAPGFTCNRILRILEIDGWDSVGSEVLSRDFELSLESTKRYSILFLILAHMSKQFKNPENSDLSRHQRYSGQAVLDKLWEERNELDADKFFRTARECIDDWLEGWGLSRGYMKQLLQP